MHLAQGLRRHHPRALVVLNGWNPGQPVISEIIFTFDARTRGLNGSCALGPGVILVADCFASLIWRVDLGTGAHHASARMICGDWAERL
jgi:hypothetical protein